MGDQTFYITTPIYYVNATPHLGHAYTTILADTMARFKRLEGCDVYFLTGTDEHGDKIAQAAAKAGETPQAFTDRISAIFRETWLRLGIAYDQFIRTTDEAHQRVVRRILQQLYQKGEIYKGEYGGNYCFGCERFYTDKELVDGKCPDHQTAPTYIREENYFFRMSRYQGWLVGHLERHPDFIRPERYRNEVLAFLREPLEDLCISRPKARLTWGIPLPFDDDYVTYVWFDALINYVSALGYPEGRPFRQYWPAAQHLIAKDIVKPHGIYWPTMLQAAGIAPYQHLNVHGYWNMEWGKMSKSFGKVVAPLELADKYGIDAFRYFLLREMVFGLDATFSEEALVARLNADLANDLGNLVSRTLTMVERYCGGRVPDLRAAAAGLDREIQRVAEEAVAGARRAMEEFAFQRALEAIWRLVGFANRYIDQTRPWDLAKKDRGDLERTLFHGAEAVRIAGLLLYPFIPATGERIWKQLGLEQGVAGARLDEDGRWGAAPGRPIRKGEALFPRIAEKVEVRPAADSGTTPKVTLEEFKRLDLRVVQIVEAEAVPKSKKLIKLTVDTGGGRRTVVAGVREHHAPEALVGRKVILLMNLKAARLMGIESQGMLLAATDAATGRVVLLAPEQDAAPGSRVS